MVAELFSKLKELRVNIQLVNGKLEIEAPRGVLNAELIGEIKSSRDQLIEFINTYRAQKSDFVAIPAVQIQDSYAASPSQRRLWVISQFEEASRAYNIPGAYLFEGNLNVAALEFAIQKIIARHETLRTLFKDDDQDGVRQHITPPTAVLPGLTMTDLRSSRVSEDALNKILGDEGLVTFNLSDGPLLRTNLYHLEDNKWIFSYVMHHIISDGWSVGVLIREIQIFYNAFLSGEEAPLKPLRIQYKDYSVWQQGQLSGEMLASHKNFWLRQLEAPIPILALPPDKKRPALKTYNGSRVTAELDKSFAEKLAALCRDNGATIFIGAVALTNLILNRYTGQEDIVIGSPAAGRDHADLENQIGFFVNTIVLRTRFNGEDSFYDMFLKTKQVVMDSFAHQVYPFDQLVDDLNLSRDLSRNAIFDVLISVQNAGNGQQGGGESFKGGLTAAPYDPMGKIISKFDLGFNFVAADDFVGIGIISNSDIYKTETTERMIGHMKKLMVQAVNNPATAIKDLPMLDEAEIKQLIFEFNGNFHTAAMQGWPGSVVNLFEAAEQSYSSATAVVCNAAHFTYTQLNERANRMSHYLRDCCNVAPGAIVGVMLEKSEWLPAALLAILKIGAVYLPVDPSNPGQRINYILENSNCKTVVDKAWIVAFHTLEQQFSSENPAIPVAPTDLAYIIYTSGSTGQPKGVMVEHAQITSFCCTTWMNELKKRPVTMPLLVSAAFDVSLFEIFLPLLSGGSILIPSEDEMRDMELLCRLLTRGSSFHAVPALMAQLTDHIRSHYLQPELLHLSDVYMAGDTVSLALLQDVRAAFPAARIHVAYGPTESTIFVTDQAFDTGNDESFYNAAIGFPLSNSRVYILDGEKRPVPIGVQGEIYTAGTSVARGYLNNPELTKEKFMPDPFVPGEKMYYTGDTGRWLAHGAIEFMGRKDAQVKIRGYRIEMGEIETVLRGCTGVDAAVVAVKNISDTEKDLVAYVTGPSAPAATEVKRLVGKQLPAYMVPSYVVHLESLPVNANGKIDRLQLPDPVGMEATDDNYLEPRTDTEKKLASLWQEVLGQAGVGQLDNFFEKGGHSLKATRLSGLLHKAFGVKIPLMDLFKNPVLKDQADVIDKAAKVVFEAIPAVEVQASYPLSSPQRRLWIISQFEQASIAYNMPGIYTLTGNLNREAFDYAFQQLVVRHENLRTTFKKDDLHEVRQFVHQPEDSPFAVRWEDRRDGNKMESTLKMAVGEIIMKPFDLENGPLIRAAFFQTADQEWVLAYAMHHIISDGQSLAVLVKELMMLYNSFIAGIPTPLQPLRIQYKDYAVWHEQQLASAAYQLHHKYWHNQLSGELPTLRLPLDFPRPAMQTFNGHSVRKILNAGITHALKAFTREHEGTLFMGLLASLKSLFYCYSGQNDMIIGTPVSGRDHADLEEQIGFYVNTLALRCRINGAGNFRSILKETVQSSMEAFEHRAYPFDKLVDELQLKRDLSRGALFDVMLTLQTGGGEDNRQNEPKFEGGIEVKHYGEEDEDRRTVSKFDLLFSFGEIDKELLLDVQYNTDLFRQDTVTRLINHLEQLITALLRHPDTALDDIDFLTPEERLLVTEISNNTVVEYPRDKSISSVFEEQVEKTPHNIAVSCNGLAFTYRKLNEEANRLAHLLRREYKVTDGDLVGLRTERSEWLITAILAILKTGAAYVPLDTGYPEGRIAYMTETCNCRLVIDDVLMSEMEQQLLNTDNQNLDISVAPNSLAYVMFTSGSTGQPKGVMVEHRSVLRLVKSGTWLKVTGDEILLSTSAISFDASTFEYWMVLLNGGRLVLCSSEIQLDPQKLAREISVNNVTVMWFTAGWLHQLADSNIEIFDGLHTILAGGDKLSPYHIRKLMAAYPDLTIINGYGPTENTTFSLTHQITGDDDDDIPVGKPVSNSTAYILHRNRQPAPPGVVGEIYVGGDGLARGYINQPALTDERFVPHPFKTGERLYKTGDLGRWMADGTVSFMGRADDQVKVRGYRIEPGEIENALKAYCGADEAVVIVRKGKDGVAELMAYVVSPTELNAGELKMQLGRQMPSYMVPVHIIQLPALPLTPNGKVDKAKLPAPAGRVISAGSTYVMPGNELQTQMVSVWQEVLGVEKVGITDNFFDLGGNSITAMKLQSLLKRQHGIEMKIKDIFTMPTIEQLTLGATSNSRMIQLTRSSDKTGKNIYCIPPMLGNSTIFKPLADKIDGRYNCFGIQFRGLERDETFFSDIYEAGKEMYGEIKAVQPSGQPFVIVGYSMGVCMAFETAKLLEADGMKPLLILIDRHASPTTEKSSEKKITEITNSLLMRYQEMVGGGDTLDHAWLNYFIVNNIRILEDYVASGTVNCPIITFETTKNEAKTDSMKTWKTHTTAGLDNTYLKCGHWEAMHDEWLHLYESAFSQLFKNSTN